MNLRELKLSLGVVPDPSFPGASESSCDQPTSHLPVRGWLAFFASYQILVGVLGLIDVAHSNILVANYLDRGLMVTAAVVTRMLFAAFLWATCLYAGIALWAKWPGCVRIARAAITLALTFVVLAFFTGPLLVMLALRRPSGGTSVLAPGQGSYTYPVSYSELIPTHWRPYLMLLLEVLWCVGWLWYLRRSRRVQLTYGASEVDRDNNSAATVGS